MITRATANKIGSDVFGLIEGKEYVLEKASIGHDFWLVYNKGTYVAASRTNYFDNFRANCEQ